MVRITDRPYITSVVYRGHKASNQSINHFFVYLLLILDSVLSSHFVLQIMVSSINVAE